MKRGFFWLIVIAATFWVGITFAFLWSGFYKTDTDETETITLPTEIPTVAYCEIFNNPDKFDGKIIRLDHKLHFEYHGLVFDADCNGQTKRTAVIINFLREQDIFKKIKLETKVENFGWGRPQITAIGKFSRRKPTRITSDSLADTLDFRFEIIEVEKAVKE